MRRINLVPEEVIIRRRVRRQTGQLAVLFMVFILALFAVWLVRQGTLREEERRRDIAQAKGDELNTKVAALQEFALLERTVKAKQATLAAVMNNDIAWSRLLIELSMTIPGDSFLTAFTGTAEGTEPGAAPPPGASAAAPGTPARIGTLTFAAVTIDDFRGVAKWLTRLQELKSLQNIWVPSATKGNIGVHEVINYASTADLSREAISGRFQPRAPQ